MKSWEDALVGVHTLAEMHLCMESMLSMCFRSDRVFLCVAVIAGSLTVTE